ncbi:MAG: TIGR00730 family Rossman fold protein [Proteobacteria bacterium]|nr:TIGR00730 family Rossman fold protein [Pseudomonadota bacterium]
MSVPGLTHVCVFCGANAGSRPAYVEAARYTGRALADAGLTLVYGGGSLGLMHAVADAALAAGGDVIGVITEALQIREVGHHGLTRLEVVRTMHERKARMAALAQAFVVLPGAYGTFDEACEMLTWNQLAIIRAPVVLVNVEGYFDGFLAQLARAVDDGLLMPHNRALLVTVSHAADILPALAAWRAPAPRDLALPPVAP